MIAIPLPVDTAAAPHDCALNSCDLAPRLHVIACYQHAGCETLSEWAWRTLWDAAHGAGLEPSEIVPAAVDALVARFGA